MQCEHMFSAEMYHELNGSSSSVHHSNAAFPPRGLVIPSPKHFWGFFTGKKSFFTAGEKLGEEEIMECLDWKGPEWLCLLFLLLLCYLRNYIISLLFFLFFSEVWVTSKPFCWIFLVLHQRFCCLDTFEVFFFFPLKLVFKFPRNQMINVLTA